MDPSVVVDAGDVAIAYRPRGAEQITTTLDQVRAEDIAAGLPIREFRWYRGKRHYSGWYWSSTTKGMVAYESRLELARIALADFDPRVQSILAQPMLLSGPDGDRVRRHVPDLLLGMTTGDWLVVDVKAPHKRGDPVTQSLMRWTQSVTALRGWGFEEWYGASAVLVANVFFLAGYRREFTVDPQMLPLVGQVCLADTTIGDIERRLGQHLVMPLVRPTVLHLLWRGFIVTDLGFPLSTRSVVRPGFFGGRS